MVRNKAIKKANAKEVKLKPTVKLKITDGSKPKFKISTTVNKTFHNKIKLFASRNNLSVSALLAAAVKEYMSKTWPFM